MKSAVDRARNLKGKGRTGPNGKSMHARLALINLKFNGIEKWVETFKQLEELYETTAPEGRLPILKEKLSGLAQLFKHVYPTLKDVDIANLGLQEALESGASDVLPAHRSTESLLQDLENAESPSHPHEVGTLAPR